VEVGGGGERGDSQLKKHFDNGIMLYQWSIYLSP
jgi:hypothetical protein